MCFAVASCCSRPQQVIASLLTPVFLLLLQSKVGGTPTTIYFKPCFLLCIFLFLSTPLAHFFLTMLLLQRSLSCLYVRVVDPRPHCCTLVIQCLLILNMLHAPNCTKFETAHPFGVAVIHLLSVK